MKNLFLTVVSLLWLAGFAAAADRPNVVFIIADDK